jgi:hypothetical protein
MQVTGLAARREYLRFFFDPVRTICRLYQQYGPVTALGRVRILQRFRFTVVPGTRINSVVAISMNPHHGLPMIIAKKDRNYSVSEVRGQIRELVDFSANGAG